MKQWLYQCLPFLLWGQQLTHSKLRQDFLAGLTGAVIVLPQGVAYAFIAGLPPEYGLYTAIVTPIVAALFGSSFHLISGPTAAISIVVMSVASSQGVTEPAGYLAIVLAVTLLAGLIQLALGLLRMGALVNFISHTVVIGFTAGAAVLIATSQMKYVLGVELGSGLSFTASWQALINNLDNTNVYALVVALSTLVTALLVRRIKRSAPHLLIGMLVGSLVCLMIGGEQQGVALVGALPGTLPPLTVPALAALDLSSLASGAFAVALLGLIEAVSIARAIAIRSHQQIDGNQEFIGQGLSNIVGSFFSCYAGSGSFTRSGANYDAGAQTPMAAIFAALLLILILLLIPGITAWLPLPAMAGAILLIAWNLIDFHHIQQILKSNRTEASVLLVTLASTLFIELEFAIYIGVFLSLAFYLKRTSQPTMMAVAPVSQQNQRPIKNVQRYQLDQCPQLKMIRIDGSLFFGAIDHVQQHIRQLTKGDQQLLIIGKGINFIDIAAAEMLVQEARRIEKQGGKLLFSSLKGTVIDELKQIGYLDKLGSQLIHEGPEQALIASSQQLDRNICNSCQKQVFKECPSSSG